MYLAKGEARMKSTFRWNALLGVTCEEKEEGDDDGRAEEDRAAAEKEDGYASFSVPAGDWIDLATRLRLNAASSLRGTIINFRGKALKRKRRDDKDTSASLVRIGWDSSRRLSTDA
jgi:hypothetical protein